MINFFSSYFLLNLNTNDLLNKIISIIQPDPEAFVSLYRKVLTYNASSPHNERVTSTVEIVSNGQNRGPFLIGLIEFFSGLFLHRRALSIPKPLTS